MRHGQQTSSGHQQTIDGQPRSGAAPTAAERIVAAQSHIRGVGGSRRGFSALTPQLFRQISLRHFPHPTFDRRQTRQLTPRLPSAVALRVLQRYVNVDRGRSRREKCAFRDTPTPLGYSSAQLGITRSARIRKGGQPGHSGSPCDAAHSARLWQVTS